MSADPGKRSSRLIDDEGKHCLGCGYNLTGQLAAGVRRCPECGRPYRPDELADGEPDFYSPRSSDPPPIQWWRSPGLVAWAFSPAVLVIASGAAGWTLPFLHAAAAICGPFILYAWAG